MVCNFANERASLIFRINVNLRKVRIFMKKEYTDILNIIVGENFVVPQGFMSFASAKELKEFYL